VRAQRLENFKLPKPDDKGDAKLIHDVVDHGCHIIGILEDEAGPRYSFSVGLYCNYRHPEVLLFDMEHEAAKVLINGLCQEIQSGQRYEDEKKYHDILDGFPVVFRIIRAEFYRDYLGYARWFYKSIQGNFPALQLIWPDKAGKFPWERGFDERFRSRQPSLYSRI
jgi:hypothetical protein